MGEIPKRELSTVRTDSSSDESFEISKEGFLLMQRK